MVSLDEIMARVGAGEDMESAISNLTWQDFEAMISGILEEHDFTVRKNFRFKTDRRWEMDVLAVGKLLNLGIDCKFWNRGRCKKSAIKGAVDLQKERANELERYFKGNEIARKMLKMRQKAIIPLIVTWFQEDLAEYNGVIVIPVWKLNNFLLDWGEYLYKPV